MKKRKIKLFASLTSLVMVVAVMAVGIWAATSATLNVSTKVNFSATGVTGSIAFYSESAKANIGTAEAPVSIGSYTPSSTNITATDPLTTGLSFASNTLTITPFEFNPGEDGILNTSETITLNFVITPDANSAATYMKITADVANTTHYSVEATTYANTAYTDAQTLTVTITPVEATTSYTDGATITIAIVMSAASLQVQP